MNVSFAKNLFPLALLVSILALGCSSYQVKRDAVAAEQRGDWDEAVLQYLQLLSEEPNNLEYRSALLRAKIAASHGHFEKAKQYRDVGQFEPALVELQEAVQLDPTNQYAQVELDKMREQVQAQREHRDILTSIDAIKDEARGVSAQPPVLDPRSNAPIDLSFPEPVSVMDIYKALGKAFGINVLFDPQLRDQQISIELKEVTAEEALEILMRASGHFYKVIDEGSIIVAADTPQNRRTYEDLVIQTFFLSNWEVRDAMTMLRSLVDSRKIAANESLNAIILRDTADRVKVAEQLIATNDKSRAEVVVDVELMQVNSQKLHEIGLSLDPGNQLLFQLDSEQVSGVEAGEGGGSTVRVSDLQFIDSSSWLLTIPNFLLDFVKETTDAQILAEPQLRISEGESGRLVIAEQVPIPVTSFNSANTIGGNIVPITSFQYQDVGIIIEVEPRVHHNNEVSLVVSVEVSNITGNVGNQPIIGTRNVETTIRLKDGETNFLAGLIRTDEIQSERGIPGLSDIPILGRLFSKKTNQVQHTDIVLTLTPHIIRRANITEADLLPIWVGTETNFSLRGGSPRVDSEVDSPFDDAQGEDAQSARERLRQRLEQLPRNLGDQPQGQPEAEEPQGQGFELAPAQAPTDRRRRQPINPPEDNSALEPPDLPPAVLEAAPPPDDGVIYASATPSSAGGGVRLSLVPLEPIVSAGSVVRVPVEVSARVPVSHLPTTLRYDPAALEFVAFEAGDFLGATDVSQVLVDSEDSGRLVIGASRLGKAPGVAGRGNLVWLRFRALREGETEVSVERARALDGSLAAVGPLEVLGGRLIVGPADGEAGGGAHRSSDE
jgi:general secretion pathway protein D